MLLPTLTTRPLFMAQDIEVHIPDKMVWTASSLRMFRSCHRKFFWKYMVRLRPNTEFDGSLQIGKSFHECLGTWYTHPGSSMAKVVRPHQKRLADLQKTGQVLCRDQKDWDKFETTVQTFTAMMLGYESLYESDKRRWKVPRDQVELPFQVDCGQFFYAGMIDLLPRHTKTDQQFVVDHKTASRFVANEAYLSRLNLDTQMRGYVFGANKGLGVKTDQVIYDIIIKCQLRRKASESQDEFTDRIKQDFIDRHQHYFHREPLRYDRHAIDAFELELRQTHAEYQRIVWPLQRGLRKRETLVKMLSEIGILPTSELHDPNDPRAWLPDDGTCNDYFRLCEFHTLCTQGLSRSTSRGYDQKTVMHEELADGD